jgi:hypothetical protein
MDFTVGQVKDLLNTSANRLDSMEVDETQIVKLDDLGDNYNQDACVMSLGSNSSLSLEFLSYLNSIVSDQSVRNSYSFNEYNKFKHGKVKPTLYTPLIKRHPTHSSPNEPKLT